MLWLVVDDVIIIVIGSAVVVMRRSRTASCRAGLTVNRVLLASQHDAQHVTPVAYIWGRQSQLWVEVGVVYNGSCNPQSCQKQKYNYSTGNKPI